MKNIHRATIKAISVFVIFVTIGCQLASQVIPTSTPAPTPTVIPSPSITPQKELPKLENLLAYLPREWGDLHLPVYFGPTITFFNFEQMRSDIGISPSLNGSNSRKEKLALITKIKLQGLDLLPLGLMPTTGSAYDEWGWDIADFQQSIYIPETETAIVLGTFGRPEIKTRLIEKGYSVNQTAGFEVYEGGKYIFAVKGNLLIIGTADKSDMVKIILKHEGQTGLNEHPSVKALLPELTGSWGVVFSPSPDIVAWQNQLKTEIQDLPPAIQDLVDVDHEVQPYKWDYMAMAYRPSSESNMKLNDIKVVYHYLSSDNIDEDIEIIKKNLEETPSFISRSLTWKDLFTAKSIDIQNTLLIIEGQTSHMSFLGDITIRRESFALLPIRWR